MPRSCCSPCARKRDRRLAPDGRRAQRQRKLLAELERRHPGITAGERYAEDRSGPQRGGFGSGAGTGADAAGDPSGAQVTPEK
jgi:hypothetical protein